MSHRFSFGKVLTEAGRAFLKRFLLSTGPVTGLLTL